MKIKLKLMPLVLQDLAAFYSDTDRQKVGF